MSIEKIRTQIVASVWQAFAQSGVDVSPISSEDQEKLVRKIADSVIVEKPAREITISALRMVSKNVSSKNLTAL